MKKSESITAISKALIEFQAKMVRVPKDSVNPHFKNKYASLSQIIDSIKKPLNECGLTIVQLPAGDHELETILLHTSGEYIAETYRMTPQRDDPQGLGSAITYQRRYALGAILCLNIDEDDDAEAATKHNGDQKTDNRPWLTDAQMQKILERYNAGESQIIEKAFAEFKISDKNRAILEEATKNQLQLT